MKYSTLPKSRSGFTLIELLVAMAITIVLLGVLVYLTGISMDTYRDSRNEVRASRQAKDALEKISKDFESMISRRDGNSYEWLYAGVDSKSNVDDPTGPSGQDGQITNRAQLIFFTGATDRYDGQIGDPDEDGGGDVSAVGYRLTFNDQIGDGASQEHAVFSLYRHLINPGSRPETDEDNTFDNLLAQENLKQAYDVFEDDDISPENFLAENIYEFTVTFLVEYTPSGTGMTNIERVTLRQNGTSNYSEFRLKGNGIVATGPKAADIANGRIMGVEVSITVLSDRGLTLAKKAGLSKEELVKKHGYHYTKTINTPRP